MSSATTITAPASQPSALRRFGKTLTRSYLPQILGTVILVSAQLSYGVLEGVPQILTSIGVSLLAEIVLGLLIFGKWPRLSGAYATGISCGILIRSPAFWPYILASLISIVSKYAIRWRGRHLINPSNLGITALLFLAPASAAALGIQWGNSIWPMVIVWTLGLMITWKLRLIHITITYVLSFIALAGLRSALTGTPFLASIAPLTGPMYQLYIFFMITDPKTIVRSKRGQAAVVFCVAVVEAILRLNHVVNAPFYALFLVGPIPFIYQIWRDGPREPAGRPAPAAVPAAPLVPSEQPA